MIIHESNERKFQLLYIRYNNVTWLLFAANFYQLSIGTNGSCDAEMGDSVMGQERGLCGFNLML